MHHLGHLAVHAVSHIAGETVPLLRGGSKKIQNTYITSIPLTEEQADLYQNTDKYLFYLKSKAVHKFRYIDFKKRIKPWQHPTTKKIMTKEQLPQIENKFMEEEKKQDKTILMTEGIHGLPAKGIFWKQYKKDLSDRCCCWLFICFTFPCVIDNCARQNEFKGKIFVKKSGNLIYGEK